MAKNLENLSLFDITPSSIIHDKNIQAIIKAIDPEFQSVSHDIREALIFSRIDELPETSIDLLAWERHVDFYEPDLGLKTKRELVKNSISWHRIKGTPAAVEQLVSTVFGNGKVSEWFEYNGRPYFFTVAVDIGENNSHDMDAAALAKLRRVIKCAQNARSWLEFIELINDFEDFESTSDDFIDVLNLGIGYYDYYPYDLPVPLARDSGLTRGEPITRNGRFCRGSIYRRSSVYPEVRRTSLRLDSDKLYVDLKLKNPFYDDYSRQAVKLARDGNITRNGIFCRQAVQIITLPLDLHSGFSIKNNFDDKANIADNNGEITIKHFALRDSGITRDGRMTRDFRVYSDRLDGSLSIIRPRRNGIYQRDGNITRRPNTLPVVSINE